MNGAVVREPERRAATPTSTSIRSPRQQTQLFLGKSVLVMGGAAGLGAATAHVFAAVGAQVAVFDVHPTDRTVDSISDAGGSAIGVYADLSEPTGPASGVSEAADRLGGLDVLVCIPSIGLRAHAEGTPLDDLELTMHIQFHATSSAVQSAVAIMRERGDGTVLLTVGETGHEGVDTRAADAAASAAVASLLRSVARAEAQHGIRINAVARNDNFGRRTNDDHIAEKLALLAFDPDSVRTRRILTPQRVDTSHGAARGDRSTIEEEGR